MVFSVMNMEGWIFTSFLFRKFWILSYCFTNKKFNIRILYTKKLLFTTSIRGFEIFRWVRKKTSRCHILTRFFFSENIFFSGISLNGGLKVISRGLILSLNDFLGLFSRSPKKAFIEVSNLVFFQLNFTNKLRKIKVFKL